MSMKLADLNKIRQQSYFCHYFIDKLSVSNFKSQGFLSYDTRILMSTDLALFSELRRAWNAISHCLLAADVSRVSTELVINSQPIFGSTLASKTLSDVLCIVPNALNQKVC